MESSVHENLLPDSETLAVCPACGAEKVAVDDLDIVPGSDQYSLSCRCVLGLRARRMRRSAPNNGNETKRERADLRSISDEESSESDTDTENILDEIKVKLWQGKTLARKSFVRWTTSLTTCPIFDLFSHLAA